MTTHKETAGHLVTGVPQPSGMAARALTTGDGTRSRLTFDGDLIVLPSYRIVFVLLFVPTS